jgi:hypothetical protein
MDRENPLIQPAATGFAFEPARRRTSTSCLIGRRRPLRSSGQQRAFLFSWPGGGGRGQKSLAAPIVNIPEKNFYRFPSGTDLLHSSAMGTEQQEQQQEQSAEERIGSMIGKIFVLALVAFFVWGYMTTLAAKLGLF